MEVIVSGYGIAHSPQVLTGAIHLLVHSNQASVKITCLTLT